MSTQIVTIRSLTNKKRKNMATKDEYLPAMRVTSELKNKLKKEADKQDRSVSNLIQLILKKAMENKMENK